MSNAYTLICRTYIRRIFASWPICICVLANLPTLIAVMIAPRAMRHGAMQCYVMPTGFIGYLIWLHFREQITNQRRFILPGFLRPHLLAFLTFALFLFVAAPVEMIWLGGFASLGLLAIGMAFFAALGWCLVTLSVFLFAMVWIAWMAMMWGPVSEKVAAFISGAFESQAYALIAISAALAMLAIVRMCRMNEENPAYRRRLHIDTRNLRPRMTGDADPNLSIKHPAAFTLVFGSLTAPRGAGLWRRALAWSSLGRGGAMVIPVLLPVIVALLRWVPDVGLSAISSTVLVTLFIIFSLLLGSTILPRWMTMWRYLETAFLYPIDRSDFLAQISLAIAINFIEAYLYLSALFMGLMWWMVPAPFDWPDVLAAMCFAAAYQVLSFATCIWLLRFRSPGWFFIGGGAFGGIVGIAAILAAKIIFRGSGFAGLLWFAPVVAIALAIIGIFVLLDARGWWQVTELG